MKELLALRLGHLGISILLVCFILFSGKLQAQNDLFNGLPEKVLTSFREHHPEVTGVSWIKEEKMFVAEYELQKTNHQLWMSDQGKILKHVVGIKDEQLPSAIKVQLYKTFPSCKILSVHQVNMQNKNFYQIRIKNAHEKSDYFFNGDGTKLKEVNSILF